MRNVEPVRALLTPFPADAMITYLVSMFGNNPANDTAACISACADAARGETASVRPAGMSMRPVGAERNDRHKTTHQAVEISRARVV